MNKKLLIVILSMFLINFSVPAFASEAVPSTDNATISEDDLKEPEVGAEKPDSDDMSNSYYIWEHLTIKYTWINGNWTRFIGIDSNGRPVPPPNFNFDAYIMPNLPMVGKDGQCVTDSFWFYMGEGLRPEKILNKLTELESKVNRTYKN